MPPPASSPCVLALLSRQTPQDSAAHPSELVNLLNPIASPMRVSTIPRKLVRQALCVGLITGSLSGCMREPMSDPVAPSRDKHGIYGQVTADGKAVEGAQVRIKGTPLNTRSAADGSFEFDVCLDVENPQVITASKMGYFIQGQAAETLPVALSLKALPTYDDESYEWVDPTPDETASMNCGNCHPKIYDEWKSGGHASSATNPHFLNLYTGTDWHNNPDVGWNLLKDYPEGAGVCNACHAPAASIDDLAVSDIQEIDGVAKHGVHCDFCHKIQDTVSGTPGLTHGRFGMSLLRPSHDQLFFGPLDDVDRGEDVYSPLQSQSQFCASCHEGIVFGVHVYSTYSEWLESPARQKGKQCQTCHMRPTGEMTNIAPDHGGIDRDPSTLASHQLLSGSREEMLSDCLKVNATLEHVNDAAVVRVTIRTENVGHRVPTGFIDRHLILAVEAFDDPEATSEVKLQKGPTLPVAAGNLANKPGKLFAKQLKDAQAPQPFWSINGELIDTRLQPDATEVQSFFFPAKTQRVRVRLIYRPFWQEVATEKQWPNDEIIVFDKTLGN